MAEDRQREALDKETQDRNTRLRRDLSNAYASLQGEQTSKSFSAYTFEEALDAQIERIEGEGTKLRPNLLERVDNIESRVLQAVNQIKEMPPEDFIQKDEEQDVNTPSEPSDE